MDIYIYLKCWGKEGGGERKEKKEEREKNKTLIHLKLYKQPQNSPEIKVKYFQINKSETFISTVTHYNKCQRKFFSLKENDIRYTSGSQRGGKNLSHDKYLRQYKILVFSFLELFKNKLNIQNKNNNNAYKIFQHL